MLSGIRAFFHARDVLEVETPLMSRFSTTDPHLESFATGFKGRPYYLNTSPEYAMKRLLASYPQAIYQVCKAFRDDELGQYHNPEFTLLEWYRPGYSMTSLIDEVSELVMYLSSEAGKTMATGLNRISYQQAFLSATGFNPHTISPTDCHRYARSHGIEVPQGLGTRDNERDAWLDWLLTQAVLPTFKKDTFTFLYDYPASQCALAVIDRNADNHPVAKRFELFFGELELANGFEELTDADEQYNRFVEDNQCRNRAALPVRPIDSEFIAALQHGMPPSAGVAIGLDRLLMVLAGAEVINDVICFDINCA